MLSTVEPASQFVFATCRAGMERTLKAEVAARHDGLLTPAFMRPQFVTWKATRPLGDAFELGGLFARVSGLSLGMFKTEEALAEAIAASPLSQQPFHLHVFPRDAHEDGVPGEVWSALDKLRHRVATHLPERLQLLPFDERPKKGATVFDVIPGEKEGDPYFLGVHTHGPGRHVAPGGLLRQELPVEAPSRAWLKMEQALSWAGLDYENSLAGIVVLELGCAPGGASYSMLKRGAEIYGVDTGAMDPMVLNYQDPATGASFTHLRMAVGTLAPQQLPPEIDVLVSDINLAPGELMRYWETLCRRHRPGLLILTLKINDAVVERDIRELLGTLRSFAPTPFRATQLAANRREICVVAGSLVD